MSVDKGRAVPKDGPTRNKNPLKQSYSTIDTELLDQIKSKLDQVEKVTDGYTAICPFHDDHHPSLFIGYGFYCRACNTQGSHQHLARHLGILPKEQKKSIEPLRKYIARRLHIFEDAVDKRVSMLNLSINNGVIRFPVMHRGQFAFYRTKKPGESTMNPSSEYLKKQGIETMKGILYGLDLALGTYEANNLGERSGNVLRGLVFLTEGEFDALGCITHNYPAVSIMGSVNSDPGPVHQTLRDAGISRVVLAFDNNEGGRQFTRNYLDHFVKQPDIFVDVCLLEKWDDLNEALQEEGPDKFIKPPLYNPIEAFIRLEGLQKMLDASKEQRHTALIEIRRFYDSMHSLQAGRLELMKLQEQLGISDLEWRGLFAEIVESKSRAAAQGRLLQELQIAATKITAGNIEAFSKLKQQGERIISGLEYQRHPEVDESLSDLDRELETRRDVESLHPELQNIRLQGFDLVTIAADTGIGKTTMAYNIIDSFLKRKKRVVFVSYEIPRLQVFIRMVALHTNRPYKDVEFELVSKDRTCGEYRGVLSGLTIIAESSFTVEQLTRFVTNEKARGKPHDLIIVDYDEKAPTDARCDTFERRVAHISQTLKTITQDQQIPVVLLSQLSDDGKLRWSRQKGNDSSIVLLLRIPAEDRKTEETLREYYEKDIRELDVIIDKNREGRHGQKTITINFSTGKIEPSEPGMR